jgi:hypothetical protein
MASSFMNSNSVAADRLPDVATLEEGQAKRLLVDLRLRHYEPEVPAQPVGQPRKAIESASGRRRAF